MSRGITHLPQLDALRGVAVALVVLLHYGYCPFGWVGVQLFFVLSGFLITSILLEDKDRPFRSFLGRFYMRRTLRIFPLYYGYLAAFTVAYWLVDSPSVYLPERQFFSRFWGFLYSYTFNFAQIRPDYWATPFFHHFWSLAIEEQYYLVWPCVVFVLSTKALRRVAWVVVAVVPVLRALTFVFAKAQTGDTMIAGVVTSGFTWCQVDAFALGGLAAIARRTDVTAARRLAKRVLAWTAALAAANWFWVAWSGQATVSTLGWPPLLLDGWAFVWVYTMIDVLAVCVVLLLSDVATEKAWAPKSLVSLGRISYGVYVFHLPLLDLVLRVFHLTAWSLLGIAVFPAYVATTLGIAALSYRYWERPFLALKDRWSRRGAPVEGLLASSS